MSVNSNAIPRLSAVARMQQLAWVALAAALVCAVWPGSSPWWWALWAAHPLTLALEFGWAAWGCRHQPERPGVSGWLKAWWGEWRASARIFGWQQPWRSQSVPDLLPHPGADPLAQRRGVLLVHGYMCNRGFWNRWLLRLGHLGHPVLAVNLEPVDGDIDGHAALIDTAVQQLTQAGGGLPPLVVAHSMGGLVVRAWMRACPGAEHRVSHVLTLGTPHQGTWLARFGVGHSVWQMRPRSAWLQALAASEPPARAARFTSWQALADNIVMPAGAAVLPGSTVRTLGAVGHVAMLDHPAVWADVLAHLEAP